MIYEFLLRSSLYLWEIVIICGKQKTPRKFRDVFLWKLLGSNQRPPACKAGALNQLS